MVSDGRRVAAPASGDTLFTLEADGAVVVTSEPYDGDARWRPVPDGSLVDVDVSGQP
jgi:glutamine amidotransferase